jgi:hypothetical protein
MSTYVEVPSGAANISVIGGAIPTVTALVGAKDPSGNMQPLLVDVSGNLLTSGGAAGSNASVGLTGAAVPASATNLGAKNGANLVQLSANGSNALLVDGSAVTQPVSAASLPLPTGAATEAKQDTGNTSLASIDAAVNGTLVVDGSGVTQPVSAVSLPLPTGAATSAAQTTGNNSLASILSALSGLLFASQPGRDYVGSVNYDYTGTPVTTSGWVELIAATSDDINAITLFDSSGQILELGFGAAASETRALLIPPGGLDGVIPLFIPSGTRVSVQAISATANAGNLVITGLS